MPPHHLRRSDEAPLFVRHEGEHRNYPYAKEIDGYIVRYRRQRWRDPFSSEDAEPNDWPTLRRRKTFGYVTRDGLRVGALELREYKLCTLDANSTILDAADADGQGAERTFYALCSQWRSLGAEVGAYGSILELSGLWMRQSEKARSGAQLMQKFVRATCRGYSITVLKAFPLEYESKLGDRPELQLGLARRMRAMQRHYALTFDVSPLPGPTGESGWMWRPAARLKSVIKVPIYSEDPFGDADD